MDKKDEKIVQANPTATPHDLLTKHGLSEAAFNELVAKQDQRNEAMLNAKPQPLKPQLGNVLGGTQRPHMIPTTSDAGNVRIIPIQGGGAGTIMSRTAAELLAGRCPGRYNIVPAN